MRRLLVGTRGSPLARRQTEEALGQLVVAHPELEVEVVPIRTGGDASPNASLVGMGRGIFVTEIENALTENRIDLAVHSLKDMPTRLPPELTIGAVCSRSDPRDALVNRWGCPMGEMPSGARVGTSSPRRAAQLKEALHHVDTVPIRGNVETRLRKVEKGEYDGVVLAVAGLRRLGLEGKIAEALSVQQFVPAPGQGALAVEARSEDKEAIELVKCLEDALTRQAVTAERAFLEALGVGCQAAVGAYGQVEADLLTLTVFLASVDGGTVMRAKVNGRADDPQEVAMDAYRRLLEQGAKALLA